MTKLAVRLSAAVLAVVLTLGVYELYAYSQYTKTVHKAVQRCSVRTSSVFEHADYENANLDKTLRNINEAIAYVDGILEDVHVHTDGSVHFRDEQSFQYMKLCGDALRSDKLFTEAAMAYLSQRAPNSPLARAGLDPAAAESLRERSYNDLLSKRAEFRSILTEIKNENFELQLAHKLVDLLIDIGSIEHAEMELDSIYASIK